MEGLIMKQLDFMTRLAEAQLHHSAQQQHFINILLGQIQQELPASAAQRQLSFSTAALKGSEVLLTASATQSHVQETSSLPAPVDVIPNGLETIQETGAGIEPQAAEASSKNCISAPEVPRISTSTSSNSCSSLMAPPKTPRKRLPVSRISRKRIWANTNSDVTSEERPRCFSSVVFDSKRSSYSMLSRRSSLITEPDTHAKEKNTCDKCQYSFASRRILSNHLVKCRKN